MSLAETQSGGKSSVAAPRVRKTRLRLLRELVLIGAITLTLSLVLLEVALRLFDPQVSPEMRANLQVGLFVADPDTDYRTAPGVHLLFKLDEFDTTIDINEQGLREEHEIGPPAPGTTRMLCLGDSFTFGWGVTVEQAYPHLLAGAHSPTGGLVECVNAGVDGYGTDNEAAWLKKYGWQLLPKIVLVGFYVGNDVRDVQLGMDKTKVGADGNLVTPGAVPSGPVANARAWLALHSHAYVFLRAQAHALISRAPGLQAPGVYDTGPLYYKNVPPDLAVGWDKATAILDTMRADAESHGATLVVVVIPTREQVEDYYWQAMRTQFGLGETQLMRDLPQQKLAAWSKSAGAPLVDLLPGFRAASGGPFYFRRDTHWNALGHALAAGLIRDALASRGLLK